MYGKHHKFEWSYVLEEPHTRCIPNTFSYMRKLKCYDICRCMQKLSVSNTCKSTFWYCQLSGRYWTMTTAELQFEQVTSYFFFLTKLCVSLAQIELRGNLTFFCFVVCVLHISLETKAIIHALYTFATIKYNCHFLCSLYFISTCLVHCCIHDYTTHQHLFFEKKAWGCHDNWIKDKVAIPIIV